MKAKDWQKATQLVQETEPGSNQIQVSLVVSHSVSYQWTKADHPP